jgi:chemotaxis protein MotA
MTTPSRRFAFTSVAGFVLAAACILGGLILEKGDLRDVGQVTVALIVFGGTAGAVFVSTPNTLILSALRRARSLIWENTDDASSILEELIRFATKARRTGIVSLDGDAQEVKNAFLKKGMLLLIDGVDATDLRRTLELDQVVFENEVENDAKVFETAGGYAPTIGIIGAVLGLIQVMKHLESLQDVGSGIAVAFVATVYGVGFANLVLLPIGNRIRARAHLELHIRELIIEGVISVQAGKNPRLTRRLLDAFAAPRHLNANSAVGAKKRRPDVVNVMEASRAP